MKSPRWLALALALLLMMPTLGDAQPAKSDALPKGAVLRIGSTRLRHAAAVTALAFAPDGKTLASAGNDSQVRLWHLADGVQTLSITDDAAAIDFAPDGKTFATVDRRSIVRIWNAADGRKLHEIAATRFGGTFKPGVRFQPDGKNVTVVSDAGGDGQISAWNVEIGKQLSMFTAPSASFFKMALSADAKRVVAGGGRDDTLGIWSVDSGKQLLKLPGQHKHLTNAGSAFSTDGRYVAAGGVFNEVTIWELATAQAIYTLPTRDSTFAFSPDGGTLASCGQFAEVRLWDLATGAERRKLPHAQAQALAYSSDSRRLATGSRDGTIRIWDADGQPRLTETAAMGGRPIAFLDDGKRLALETPSGVAFYALTVDGKADPWSARLQHQLPGMRGQIAPDGSVFVGLDASRMIVLWDIKNNTERRHLGRGDDIGGPAFAFTSDSRTLALTTNRGIALIETESGKTLNDPDKFAFRAGLAFTPDGKTLIAADGKTLRLCDVTTAKVVRHIPRDPKLERDFDVDLYRNVPTLRVSSTGNVLALGGMSRPVQLWDIGKVAPIGAPKDSGPFTFSRDGRWLATAQNGSVRLWELATGKVFAELKGHSGAVTSLLFSPDGQVLASGGADHTTLLWDVRLQRLFAPEQPSKKWDDAQRIHAWDALAALDSEAAYAAMVRFALDSAGAAVFLDERLTPVVAPSAKQLDQWIGELGSKNFKMRSLAAVQLQKVGILAQTVMQDAMKANIELEQKRRIEALLAQIGNDEIDLSAGDQLRVLRAIHLLETLRSSEARRVLERLATGAPQASQTTQAQRALQRLNFAER